MEFKENSKRKWFLYCVLKKIKQQHILDKLGSYLIEITCTVWTKHLQTYSMWLLCSMFSAPKKHLCGHIRYGNWKKLYIERWNVFKKTPRSPAASDFSTLRDQHERDDRESTQTLACRFCCGKNKSLIFSGRNPFFCYSFLFVVI